MQPLQAQRRDSAYTHAPRTVAARLVSVVRLHQVGRRGERRRHQVLVPVDLPQGDLHKISCPMTLALGNNALPLPQASPGRSPTSTALRKLEEQYTAYTAKVAKQRREGEELDRLVSTCEAKIVETRERLRGPAATAGGAAAGVQKAALQIENRVAQAQQRLDGALAVNGDLHAKVGAAQKEVRRTLPVYGHLPATSMLL